MTLLQPFRRIARCFFWALLCAGIAAGLAACQVFDGETTDTSEYECPELMPIMTPDGNCTASLDDALAMVESMDDPELLISPGDYTLSKTIEKPITIRSSRARAFPRPGIADFERIDCALIPGIIGHGLDAKAIGLEHEPKIILRAADPKTGIVVKMLDDAHRMTLIGAELHGREGGPAISVLKGKIGLVQSRIFSPIKVTGTKSRLFLDGVRMSGAISSILDGETSYGEDSWSLYDVYGACDDALLVVDDGAVVNSVGVELAEHSPLGLCVNDAKATLCGGSIHDIIYDDDYRLGRGAHVTGGGRLSLRGVDLYGVQEVGVWAKSAGTELSLSQDTAISQINFNGASGDLQMSVGVVLDDGAALIVDGATISDVEGVGIWLTGGSSATIDDLAIEAAAGAGIAVFDATLAVSSSSISNTEMSVNAGGGDGIYIDPLAMGPGVVEMSDTTISDNLNAGILINGEGSSVMVTGGTISGSYADSRRLHDGFGIAAVDVCSGLEISGVTFEDNYNAHIILAGSNATMESITFNSTGCGYSDFVQQECTVACVTTLSTSDVNAAGISDPPNTIEICPYYDYSVYHDDLTLNLTIAEPEG